MTTEPIKDLFSEVPPEVCAKTLDDVIIDYSIFCIRQRQTVPAEEAVTNIRIMRKMMEAFAVSKAD